MGLPFPVRIDEGPPHTARKLQSLYWWTLFLQRDFLGEELFAVLLWEGLSVRRLFARALRGADELLTCCRPKFQQDFFRHRRGLRWRFPRAWEVLHPKSTERDPEPEALGETGMVGKPRRVQVSLFRPEADTGAVRRRRDLD